MKMAIKNIFSVLFFLCSFSVFSQEPSFYIRSIRSIHLDNKVNELQAVPFKSIDVVYNKICQFVNDEITVDATSTYEVSAFANINPGIMGTSTKDSIQMELYLIKNAKKSNEHVLAKTCFTFTYGNFDVAAGLNIPITTVHLQQNDAVSLWVKILPTSTVEINKSDKYHHITKPTGMEQIAAIRIAKVLK